MSGPTSAAAPSSSSDAQLIAQVVKRHRGLVAAAVIVVVLGVVGIVTMPRRTAQPPAAANAPTIENFQITQLTTSGNASRPVISPDGKYRRRVPRPDSGGFAFTPDGRAIAYVTGDRPNLWAQPLNGGPRRQITHFTDDRSIAAFAWSPDGKRLAVVRSTVTNDIVLFKGLKR